LNEILIHWDVTEKDADLIAEAVKTGLEDAAVRGKYHSNCISYKFMLMLCHMSHSRHTNFTPIISHIILFLL
jgi:hypothetical protein